MNFINKKHLLFYPILFGVLGAFLGLITRYLFVDNSFGYPIKFIIHSHSHVMLLGFLFNTLSVFIWQHFTDGIDKLSYKIYLFMQIAVAGMLVAFILQGYAFYSILFSTLHLWLSYVFVVRIWKRLRDTSSNSRLIKIGIVFHFISSIGPYCLGPLMAFEMQESPWYQQAIFFYLHFQFFGILFLWLLATFLKKTNKSLSNLQVNLLTLSVIGLYAHSLNYSFNYWLINSIGGLSASILVFVLFSLVKHSSRFTLKQNVTFYTLLLLSIIYTLGSFPFFASMVVDNHFVLIAWLHFLFLGLYTPFIWLQFSQKTYPIIWIIYTLSFVISELILIFPNEAYQIFNTSIMQLLFYVYIVVFLCFGIVHGQWLVSKRN